MHRLHLQVAALDEGPLIKQVLLPLLLLLGACSGEAAPEPEKEAAVDVPEPSGPPIVQQADEEAEPLPPANGPAWESAASGEGMALRLTDPGGKLLMSMACLGGPSRLVVTVPGFSAIGSEDRFSLGLGEEPVTLVADLGRRKQPGLTAEGPVPPELEELLEKADRVSALYGTQQVGPHPAPKAELRDQFAKACKPQ